MKMRKTAHNYQDFSQEVQEEYFNRRFQLGYLKAGYWLMVKDKMRRFLQIVGHIAIASIVIGEILKVMKQK